MYTVHIVSNSQKPITSVSEWRNEAPPAAKEKHWKSGRSAKELARAWVSSGASQLPSDLETALKRIPCFPDSGSIRATAEKTTKLDDLRNPRHHDLFLDCQFSHERVVVGIEAKADEQFGPLICQASSVTRREGLSKAIFGTTNVGELRYQLLHGVAGTLIEAAELNAKCAIFLVHEFHHPGLNPSKLERNKNDYDAFIERLAKGSEQSYGSFLGPIQVPGGYGRVPKECVPLYIGRVVSQIVV